MIDYESLFFASILGFLIYFFGPRWLNRFDLPPAKSQHKCSKHRSDITNDPRLIPRPNDSLKIIRLTNSGEFVDRCDLTNVLYELNWDHIAPAGSFGATLSPEANSLPKLAVLYIHGWKHGFREDDSDLQNFKELITDLRTQHKDNKNVIGIYVGWNASAGLPGFLENISFWVKKNNADRIAQSAVMTKIISAIGSIKHRAFSHNDQFIAIGHSFGARVLFSATAQSLVYDTECAHPGFPGGKYNLVKGAADAVILLNPAFEASRYTAIDDFARKEEQFRASQAPLLITVSTENDWATKLAFPLGQWLGRATSRRELTTLGNYRPYMTHSLEPSSIHDDAAGEGPLSERFSAAGFCLKRLRGSGRRIVQAHNPFIVACTTRAVIDGHNGIWTPQFRCWLTAVITALEVRSSESVLSKDTSAE